MRVFFRFCVKEGYIDQSPVEQIDRQKEISRNYWDFQKEYQFRLEKSTLVVYTCALTQFFNFINVPLAQISKREIRSWLQHLMDIGLKPAGINKKLAALRTFFKYCLEEKWIQDNPANKVPVLITVKFLREV